jgi:predicted nucleotide-binding protein
MAQKKEKTRPEKTAERGKIKSDFPKHTLEEALRVAQALENANGGKPLPPIETATALGISPGSSDLRVILSSSIKYGLTSGSYNQERVSLEELGRQIVEPKSPEEKHRAIVTAALQPPTFRAIYDYYKGKKLPEPTFFQNTVIREFGVPREHSEKCISVFNANSEFIGLIRMTTSGRWLTTEPIISSEKKTSEAETGDVDLKEEAEQQPEEASASQLQKQRSDKNAIFLGHGKNKKPLEQLKHILDQYKIPYKVAIQEPNVFRPISQKVADTMKECGAAILLITADEEFKDASDQTFWRPSENVVYELGAASVLYGGKIIIFKEDGVVFPTNFRDIGYIPFDKDALSSKTNELFAELIAFGLIKVTVGGD